MHRSSIQVIFRDRNHSGVVDAVKGLFPEWDVAVGDIFSAGPADLLVSPANCTGRMDGGIDQVYINRFGGQLEARLMRDIRILDSGRLPIGKARVITTYDETIPMMICAPTMDWPPGDVSQTQNAYLAFKAALDCATLTARQVFGRSVTLLVPGLGTGTGRMSGQDCAMQMRRAWEEFHVSARWGGSHSHNVVLPGDGSHSHTAWSFLGDGSHNHNIGIGAPGDGCHNHGVSAGS